MGKQSKIEFQMFPTSEELIHPKKYEQKSDFLKKTEENNKIRRSDNNDLNASDDSSTMESSISSATYSSSSSLLSSEDLMEDATSSSSSSSNGPLFQLSDLMDKLPIKRGLSKYYEGKSESFTSLASVGSLEDLAKRENPYRKKLKFCRSSYFCSPKSKITKKNSYSRNSFSSSTLVGRNCSKNLLSSCKPPHIPHVQKEF